MSMRIWLDVQILIHHFDMFITQSYSFGRVILFFFVCVFVYFGKRLASFLCLMEVRQSYWFGMTLGRINDDRICIFR